MTRSGGGGRYRAMGAVGSCRQGWKERVDYAELVVCTSVVT